MRTKGRNRNSLFCIGFMFILIIGLTNCKKESKHNGFVLQNFKVINSELISIINGIKDSAYILKESDDVIILELKVHDSVPMFCLTSAKRNKLNEYFIYSSNSRIVGYIEDKKLPTEIIVLSDINNKVSFELAFYKFLIPTEDKKYFEYIYFPDNQYSIDARGFGAPPPLFDPYYYYFIYKGNNIIPMNRN